MQNDLIDRYVYAVTRRMRRKVRGDVSRELYGLIDDLLTERCGSAKPTEKDIRVVLTELGSPQELWEKYDENSKGCLIGQPYYSEYLFVLRIVLGAVALGMTISAGIHWFLEKSVWYVGLGSWLGLLWSGGLSAFAVVTILFAVLSRKGVQLQKPLNFDELPPVPKKETAISIWEPVVGMVLSLVFLVVFLVWPQVLALWIPDQGVRIPIFNLPILGEYWYILVLFSLLGIIREAVKLRVRRYDRRVLANTVTCDALSGALAIWWLNRPEILNPAFSEFMETLFTGESMVIRDILSQFQYFFLGVLLFSLVLDIIDTTAKTLSAAKN